MIETHPVYPPSLVAGSKKTGGGDIEAFSRKYSLHFAFVAKFAKFLQT